MSAIAMTDLSKGRPDPESIADLVEVKINPDLRNSKFLSKSKVTLDLA